MRGERRREGREKRGNGMRERTDNAGKKWDPRLPTHGYNMCTCVIVQVSIPMYLCDCTG